MKDAVDNGHIDKNIRVYHFGKNFDGKGVEVKNISPDLPKFSTEFLIPTDADFTSEKIVDIKFSYSRNFQQNFTLDILLYFYTSGTTGLPKPAIITQAR